MNYLAHAALSPTSQQTLIGNLIGDHIRGSDLSHLPKAIEKGVRLHRYIDHQFDHHPNIVAIRRQLPNGLRRFVGISLDLWFDNWLSNHWHAFYAQPLVDFQVSTSQTIQQHIEWIPNSQKPFMEYLCREQLFLRYRSENQITKNLKLLAKRLTKSNGLLESLEWLKDHSDEIVTEWPNVYSDMIAATEEFLSQYDQ